MKFRKKLGKRILAFGMTVAVCFTSVIGSVPLSFSENMDISDEPDMDLNDSDFEQLDDETSYTVTIADCENGSLYFYDSESGTKSEEIKKEFLAGDKVELVLEADEGYYYSHIMVTDKDGEYESVTQIDNAISFIMPEYDTNVKAVFSSGEVTITGQEDGTFLFNGMTTLQGSTVTGKIGNNPNPYAVKLTEVIRNGYGIEPSFTGKVYASNCIHKDYIGNASYEWCAGTAHYVIDTACETYYGTGIKPFNGSNYFQNLESYRSDGFKYSNLNFVTFNDLRALEEFADNNNLKMTIQDSAVTNNIEFNKGDIVYWLYENSITGTPSNVYTKLPYGSNGKLTGSNTLTSSMKHVNIIYDVGVDADGKNYITIFNNRGGSDATDATIYLAKVSGGFTYGLSNHIQISAQGPSKANRILVVHFEEDDASAFKIQKNGGSTTFPTATYSNGIKTEEGAASLSSIASKYDGFGSLSDARFTVKNKNGDTVDVYTDEKCTVKAVNGSLKAGVTYYTREESIVVYETTAPLGWSKETEGKTVTLNNQTETTVAFTDNFYGDPSKLTLEKKGKTKEKIQGAKFTVTCNETGEKWTYRTDKDGLIDFGDTAYLYSGSVYFNKDNKIQFFLGTYTIKESEPAAGYLAEGDYFIDGVESGSFNGSDDVIAEFAVIVDDADNGTEKTSINNVFITNTKQFDIEETPKMMGFEVHKVYKNTSSNTVVGDMNNYTTKFKLQYIGRNGAVDDGTTLVDYSNGNFTDTVTYNKGDYIYAPSGNGKSDSLLWTTDANGSYKSGSYLLQAGTYRVVEEIPPKGFIMWSGNDKYEAYFPGNNAVSTDWQNVADGYICLMQKNEGLVNTEIRGGVGGYKYDADSLLNKASYGSSFDGIEFWIRNDSSHDVYLDTNADGVGETLLKSGESYKFYTLGDGSSAYYTNPTFLSYGTYTIYEKQGTNTNYIVDETKSVQIVIREDLEYYTLCKNQNDADELKNTVNTKYSSLINTLGNTYSDGFSQQVKRTVNYKLLGTDLNSFFANDIGRHGVALIKYDVDDYANASGSLNVVNGEYYPEPQGDAVLTGAKYQIINRNDGEIYLDTDNDHIGDTKVEKDGVCAEITTTVDKTTGIEYACTSKTLLPCGKFEVVEVAPPKGYLVGKETDLMKHTYTSTNDGQYYLYASSDSALNKLKDIVNIKYPASVFGNHTHTVNWVENKTDSFANPVIRGQLTIEKHDADRKENNIEGSQGDAVFENAVYEIYNISEHYVYTKGTNNGTSLTRYETGKNTFKNLTGLDVDSIIFEDGINKTFLSDTINNDIASKIRNQMADNMCYTLVLDEDGKASTDTEALPYGTYLILEKTPSEGYLNSIKRDGETAKIIRIREDKQTIDMTYDYNDLEKSLYEPVIRGGFELYKYDEETRMNIPLGSGNLAASFEVINRSESYVWVDSNEDGSYSDDECYAPGEVVYTFTTDELTGKFTSDNTLLPYGTYEIHETYPPTGYLHLSNINPEMSVFFEIREEGKIVTEGWYYDSEGNKITSTSHYEPMNVYLEDGTKIPNAEIAGERKEVTDARLIIYNQVIRGDLYFEKKSAITMKKMAYIPFLMASYDEKGNVIEQHVIFTDQNGDFNTSSLYVDHTYETNSGDELYNWLLKYEEAYENEDSEVLNSLDAEYVELVDKYKSGIGTWFGVNTTPNNDLGALPFGKYTITELRCPNNNGYDMVSDTIIVDTNSGETDATTDPEGYKNHSMHGTINFGTIYNTLHGLTTVALTQDEQSHYSYAYSDLVIIDTVQYENVVAGRKYKLVAELHDQETGDILYDAFGKEIKVTKEFTPELSTGSIDMNIDFDASDYKDGGAVVVYEYLYDITDTEDGILSMKEDNPFEEDQTIYFPRITSELISNGSNHHIENAKEDITLVDTIYYENLEPNKTYVIEGYLIDKAEIDYAEDDYGNHIVADIFDFNDSRLSYNGDNEIIFKPTEATGSFKLSYKFDGESALDKAYVSFVEITKNRNVIATHMDISDESQTIYFSKIGTKAYDSKTKNHLSFAENNIKIIDVVEYSNVYPNIEYTIRGKLYNKDTGEMVCDENGNEITSSVSFTPSSSSGEVEVEFIFDGSLLEGTSLVAYETLYYSDYELADHEDSEDEEQTIHIPKIRTKARDSINGTQIVNPDGTISITDTITYNNLLTECKYIVKGYLMDKDTNEPLLDKDGNEIVAEQVISVEDSDGETTVTFSFDGYNELKGKTVVVFEELYVISEQNDTQPKDDDNKFDETDDDFNDLEEDDFENLEDDTENKEKETEETINLIAVHKDIEDNEQTIYFPEIHTTAYDKDVCLNITKADETTIVDTVAYYNLVDGIEYTIKGVLVDKNTGEPLLVNGEQITSEKKFTTQDIYGTEDVIFKFDASEFSGISLVVYEELYVGEFVVAAHKDINDESQTVYIPNIRTQATDNKTNTHLSYADNEVTITDTVSYENLVPGKQYLLVAQLMDKNSGNAIFLENGTEFIPEELEHSDEIKVIVSDKINDTNDNTDSDNKDDIENKKEDAEDDNDGIDQDLADEDFEDLIIEGQSDEFGNDSLEGLDEPDIDFDDDDNDNINESDKDINADNKDNTGTDDDNNNDISDNNATNTDTDAIITDDIKNDIIIKESNGGYYVLRYFTPVENNGTVDMTFIFDATGFKGNCTVAFEELYVNGCSIAEHKNINDENQTVSFPELKTTATNKADNTHYAEATGEITINDKVEYSGLIVGKEYTVSGTLMIKETGNPLYRDMCEENSQSVSETERVPVSATKTFVAETSEGTIDLDFTFNASLLHGKTIVVFEDLYLDNIKVGTHADITDKDQSVHLVKISTVAIDENTKTHTATYGKTTIIDTVSYEGLVPGEEYIISGKLMDKTTNNPLTIGDNKSTFETLINGILGNSNEFIGEIKFTPTESSGAIEIKFEIDTTNLDGKTIVVYEKLYHNGKIIAHHEDMEDKNQTIDVPTPPTSTPPRTGVGSVAKIILCFMVAFGGVGIFLIKRKKKRLL